MIAALHTTDLGKRYGRQWALRDCTLELPPGRVAALVGPNGAGKTTLLQMAVGLTDPSIGDIRVFGQSPRRQPTQVLPRVGFVAQDQPLYRGFSIEEMLKMGRKLNPRWDDTQARTRLTQLGLPLDKKVGKLSGGQRSQVALALALSKRPDLLVLDEPVASLDPLARREFLRALADAAGSGLTVLLSSHIIADLERVCDYLIILSAARVRLMGEIAAITRSHKLLVGPRRDADAVSRVHTVIHASHEEHQTTLLVLANGPVFDATWEVREVPLEEIVLAYLGQSPDGLPAPRREKEMSA